MNKERQIIFECPVGSKLYGTDRPDSDTDLMGIFLPSTEDMLSLGNCPTEWTMDVKNSTGIRNTVGDVDRKFYSVQKFLNLASQGQPKQLEMLFCPRNMWVIPTRAFAGAWSTIYSNRELFLSKSAVLPFIGFAKAQAYRAFRGGNNLNNIREMIKYLESISNNQCELGQAITPMSGEYGSVVQQLNLSVVTTEGGLQAIEIAGRQFEFTQQIRYVLQKLRKMEEKYGTRTEAASQQGYDYKSLVHAYRLIFQAKELLETGVMTFPRPKEEVKLLQSIRTGDYQTDYFQEIEDKLTELREIKSDLPETVNYSKINDMCQELLYNHLF